MNKLTLLLKEGAAMQCQYLSNHNLLRATDFRGLAQRLADVLPPHRYSLPRRSNSFSYCLNQVPLAIGSLSFSSWSHGTTVSSYDFDTYVAVILVEGIEDFETRSHRWRWSPGDGAVFNPGESFTRTALTDCSHLTLRISPQAVDQYLSGLLPRRPARSLLFDAPITGSTRRGSAVSRTLEFAAAQLSLVDAQDAGRVVRDLEHLLLDSLLFLQPNSQSQAIHGQQQRLSPKYVSIAERYIEAHCAEDITLKTLAGVAGVGVRALNAAFRKYRGTSPMQYLKSVRLEMVRRELQSADSPVRVADVATRWGFFQLGWFAAQYRKAYGELPSETLGMRADPDPDIAPRPRRRT